MVHTTNNHSCPNTYASSMSTPCVEHEANMWYPCCMTTFCSRTFYFLLLSPMINVVTTPSDVTDVTNDF